MSHDALPRTQDDEPGLDGHGFATERDRDAHVGLLVARVLGVAVLIAGAGGSLWCLSVGALRTMWVVLAVTAVLVLGALLGISRARRRTTFEAGRERSVSR